MKILPKFEHYCDVHCPFVLDLMRIIIGAILFYKGVMFVQDSDSLNQIINNSRIGGMAFILEHHVAFTLLVGGILIAIGMLTRLAILFQFPVFIGAIVNQHVQYGLYSVYSELTFSIIITLILIALFVVGSGPFSVDHYLFKPDKSKASI
jgi:uncharacterized membrane protein YphA (DoxX/SURF4 family)